MVRRACTAIILASVVAITLGCSSSLLTPVHLAGVVLEPLEDPLISGQETAFSLTVVDQHGSTLTDFTGTVTIACPDTRVTFWHRVGAFSSGVALGDLRVSVVLGDAPMRIDFEAEIEGSTFPCGNFLVMEGQQ